MEKVKDVVKVKDVEEKITGLNEENVWSRVNVRFRTGAEVHTISSRASQPHTRNQASHSGRVGYVGAHLYHYIT